MSRAKSLERLLPMFSLGILLIGLAVIGREGTRDVSDAFVPWIENAERIGFLENYRNTVTAYPPGYILLPYLLATFTSLSAFMAYKLSLLFSIAVCHFFTSKLMGTTQALVLDAMLIYTSLILGYGDSLLIATILILVLLLKQERYLFSGITVGILIAIKFTPLIILPPIFLFVFRAQNLTVIKPPGLIIWKDISKFSLGFILWEIPFVLITGVYIYLENLKLALLNGYLSGNAMNLGWILTKIKMGPNSIPEYSENSELIRFIYIDVQGGMYKGMKLIAGTLIILIVIQSLRLKNSIENTAFVCLLSIFVYYEFAPGVHENHLTLTIPFAIILLGKTKNIFARIGLLVSSMSLINLLVIYGTTGRVNEKRILLGTDFTLLISFIEVMIALGLIIFYLFPRLWQLTWNLDGKNGGSVEIP
jgi:hypothetical protein